MKVKLKPWLDCLPFEMENNFTIRKDFILRYRRRDYTYNDISQAVSYWLNQINKTTGIIGISYASLSFSGVSFLLALYKSQRPFVHLGVMGKNVTQKLLDSQQLGAIFVIGDLLHSTVTIEFLSDQLHLTDTWDHACNCLNWPDFEDLIIPFTDQQVIKAYTSGSTGKPSQVSMSAYVESLSIKLAMDSFFIDDDYCVFSHGMAHMGVHTTAILPGVFKARIVSLSDFTWDEEIEHATHIQFFPTMTYLKLPKKLRVITTGGNSLKSTLLEFILSQCQVENIYDIYGLTECLPPLAVRNVHSFLDLNTPFTWINQNYQVEIINDRIKITRPDNVVFITNDKGRLENNRLTFLGRALNLIRVNGNLVNVEDFKQLFETKTNILNYVIESKNNEFVLHVLTSDTDLVTKFISYYDTSVLVKYHVELDTNGGIKNIS